MHAPGGRPRRLPELPFLKRRAHRARSDIQIRTKLVRSLDYTPGKQVTTGGPRRSATIYGRAGSFEFMIGSLQEGALERRPRPGRRFLALLRFDGPPGNGSAVQARSGGGERLAAGGVHDELVEGLANRRGRDATLCRCPDLGPPRVICVFDAAIGITAGQPLRRRPDVETISAGMLENRSDNDIHVRPSNGQCAEIIRRREGSTGVRLVIPIAINTAATLSP